MMDVNVDALSDEDLIDEDECRVATAIMAMRAAATVPDTNDDTGFMLLDVVQAHLDDVLDDVMDGSYVPSEHDAMAALGYALEAARRGWSAEELRPLIEVARRAVSVTKHAKTHQMLDIHMAERTSINSAPALPFDTELVCGSKARVYSWTDGGYENPIVGVYWLGLEPHEAPVAAKWRADGTMATREVNSAPRAHQALVEVPASAVVLHSEHRAEIENERDPLRALTRELMKIRPVLTQINKDTNDAVARIEPSGLDDDDVPLPQGQGDDGRRRARRKATFNGRH